VQGFFKSESESIGYTFTMLCPVVFANSILFKMLIFALLIQRHIRSSSFITLRHRVFLQQLVNKIPH